MSIASRSSSASDRRILAGPDARSLTGARSSLTRTVSLWGVVAGLALAALATTAAAAASAPLPWRVGGRVAFTVDAAGFPDSAGYVTDVYVRVPASTITLLENDPQGTSQLKLSAELRSSYGAHRQTAEQLIIIAPGDTSGGFGKVVVLRFPTRPGTQKLKVRLEDVLSHKTGIVNAMRSARESGEVSGEFELVRAVKGLDLSDAEFGWESREGEFMTPFERAGRVIVPNPERLYGLLDTDLPVVFSARSADATRGWHARARILDARGQEVASQDTAVGARAQADVAFRFDVSRLPAGGYDLETRAWQEGDATPLQRTARFSVAWRPESWRRSSSEMADLAHFLFDPDDEEHFAAMAPGEQERWLEDFWRKRDPSPETGINEARDAFLKRVDIANERFTRAGIGRGMFSDMGRVYIRYGEPSEELKQVMPAGDETLLQELQELAFDEDRDLGDIQQKGPGGDIRPYEVWVYEGDIPLPLDLDPREPRVERHKKLVFLFVDDRGLGDYRLRYSNE